MTHLGFHNKSHFARLVLSCYLSQSKKIVDCWKEGSTSATDIVEQHNRICFSDESHVLFEDGIFPQIHETYSYETDMRR